MSNVTDPKPFKAYVHQEFPKFVFSAAGKREVKSVQELAELVEANGPGFWFDSPEKVPAPTVKAAVDWKAKYDELAEKHEELRKVNGDLVAKLTAKPEPKAKPELKPDAK